SRRSRSCPRWSRPGSSGQRRPGAAPCDSSFVGEKTSGQVRICNRPLLGIVPRPVTAPPGRRRALTRRVRGLAIDVSPLRASRDFRLLWTGVLVSQIGSQFTVVALLVQVYDLTHSSAAVGLIGAVQ